MTGLPKHELEVWIRSFKGSLSECMIGETFDHLTIIGPVQNLATNEIKWLCRCDCGKRTVVTMSYLTSSQFYEKSCGCFNTPDFVGQKVRGRLTVLQLLKDHRDLYRTEWLCRCDCGKEFTITGLDLDDNRYWCFGKCDYRPDGSLKMFWKNRFKKTPRRRKTARM
jgi:hypothetical protein